MQFLKSAYLKTYKWIKSLPKCSSWGEWRFSLLWNLQVLLRKSAVVRHSRGLSGLNFRNWCVKRVRMLIWVFRLIWLLIWPGEVIIGPKRQKLSASAHGVKKAYFEKRLCFRKIFRLKFNNKIIRQISTRNIFHWKVNLSWFLPSYWADEP